MAYKQFKGYFSNNKKATENATNAYISAGEYDKQAKASSNTNIDTSSEDASKKVAEIQQKAVEKKAQQDSAPNEVFGSESYEYFKKNHPDTPDGFFSKLGYVLETPYRVPALNKFLGTAATSMGGEKAIATNSPTNLYKDTTGNKVVDTVASLGGNLAGLASVPTNTTGGNLLNFSDDIAAKAGEKVASKLGNRISSKVAGGITRGAVDGGLGTAVDDIRLGNTDNIIGDTAKGALGGGLLFGGGKLLGESKNSISKGLDNSFSKLSDNSYMPNDFKSPLEKNSISDKFNKTLEESNTPINKESTSPTEDNLQVSNNIDTLGKTPFSKPVAPQIEGMPFKDASTNELTGIGQGKSKFKENTLRNSDFMQGKDTQNMVDDVTGVYNIKSNEQSYSRASKMLSDDFEGTISRIRKEGIGSAEDSVASGLITKDLIQSAKNTGDYDQVREWLDVVRPQATNAGQIIQALSTWQKISPEGTLLKAKKVTDSVEDAFRKADPRKATKMDAEIKATNGDKNLVAEIKKKYGISDFTDDEMKSLIERSEKVEKMEDSREKDILTAQIKQMMADKIPPTLSEKVSSLQRINLLLNTKTMTRNVLGNIGMLGLENIKDIPASIIDKGLSKITGNRTTLLPSLEGAMTQGKGLIKGAKNTLEDYKLGIDTSMSQGQYELPSSKAFRGDGLINKTLSKAEDLTTTGLKLGDNPFYTAAYDDTLRQQMKIGGVNTPTEEMKAAAKKVAEDRTFQTDSKISTAMKTVQNALNFRKTGGDPKFGLGSIIMPFVKTPANILDKAIDYSPIGGLKGLANLAMGLKLDKLDQKQVVDQLGRGLTGSALIGTGVYLAEQGLLEGSAPKDAEAAALQKQSGILPYSIKIGDKYTTIDWAQPMAIPLMIGADMAKSSDSGESVATRWYNALTSGSSTLFNQSVLQGVGKLFGGYSFNTGENLTNGILKAGLSAPSQFVPFNSLLKQVNDFTDTKVRDTTSSDPIQSEVNKIKNKIPGLSESLPEKVDTVGNTSTKYNNSADNPVKYAFNSLFNPGSTAKFNPTDAEKVALDIYNDSGDVTQMPRQAEKKITYTPKGSKNGEKSTLILTPQERNDLQSYLGQATEKAYSKLPKSYDKLSSSEKAEYLQKLLTEIKKNGQEELLKIKGIKIKK